MKHNDKRPKGQRKFFSFKKVSYKTLALCFGVLFLSLFAVYKITFAPLQAKEVENEAAKEEQIRAAQQTDAVAQMRDKMRVNDTEGLKVVYLTFDDGPSSYTNQLLDTLAANDVKATFFTNGRTDETANAAYRRIVSDGHTLANHTWSHDYSLYEDPAAFLADVQKLHDYQVQVTGKEPAKVFRFPGGSLNSNQACVDALAAQGYNYVDWNVDCEDGLSNSLTADQVFQRIVDGVHEYNVSVVLMHAEGEKKQGSRDALDPIIKQLKQEGYTFLTLEEDIIHQRQVDVSTEN